MKSRYLARRQVLKSAAGVAGSLVLSGCDNLSRNDWFRNVLEHTEALTERVQRALTPRNALAKEYAESEISALFPSNGNSDPGTEEYAELAQQDFAKWRLVIGGLVLNPVELSLAALKEMPSRTQITRHDCVEGWSAIGKWTGVPLGDLMHQVQPMPAARYAVFYCADIDEQGVAYYESMGLEDLYHPQTILAYELNGKPLDVPHGAPIRLRFERQLGYKHAKYIMSIKLVDSLVGIGDGRGGYWEDQGYEWYAGI